MGFKLRFKSSSALSKGIERNAAELKNMIEEMEGFGIKFDELFRTLKEAKKKLTKLKVQKSELKEESPRLINLYEKNEELVARLNSLIEKNVKGLLSVLDAIATKLRNITFDADTLFYREDRNLTKLAEKVKKLDDVRLRHKLIVLINQVKSRIKSITLRLLEASRLEEEAVMLYPSKRKTAGVPKKIKELGVEVGRLEKVSAELAVKNISQILKTAMLQVDKLKAIELDVLVLMPSIDRQFARLKDRMYLLEEGVSEKTLARIESSKKGFKDIKSGIAKQALKLFEIIKIKGEKKVKK